MDYGVYLPQDTGNCTPDLRRQLTSEQQQMHQLMVTKSGHIMIKMARLCMTNPGMLEDRFPHVNPHVAPILRNLDKDVLQLIADTPLLKQ